MHLDQVEASVKSEAYQEGCCANVMMMTRVFVYGLHLNFSLPRVALLVHPGDISSPR